jgi:hypothetical protein
MLVVLRELDVGVDVTLVGFSFLYFEAGQDILSPTGPSCMATCFPPGEVGPVMTARLPFMEFIGFLVDLWEKW